MISREQVLNIERTDKKFVRVKHIYVDMAGDFMAGVVLSEIVYWHAPDEDGNSRLRKPEGQEYEWLGCDRRGWWKRSRITAREFDNAVKKLVKANLIFKATFEYFKQERVHVRINWDVFLPLFDKFLAVPQDEPVKRRKGVKRAKVSPISDTPQTTEEVSLDGDEVSPISDTVLPISDRVSPSSDTKSTYSINEVPSSTQKDSSPQNGDAPAEKTFDVLSKFMFPDEPALTKQDNALVGIATAWLEGKTPTARQVKRGLEQLTPASTIPELKKFYSWYKVSPDTRNANFPVDVIKLQRHYRDFRKIYPPQPAAPDEPEYYEPTAEELAHMEAIRAAALAKVNGNGRLSA